MHYYVHTETDNQGDYEVHHAGCLHIPLARNREYLGYFSSCTLAVARAKEIGYKTADGCYWCSPACHTS
ncbi:MULTISPECIES: hypothetical protein [unclassified Xenorhabdus]|uniref:hypothetical protein n=1 Tax=unclassified Xenorhabdus TaxID=2632833 RepID=UPI000C056EF8|nr:MULTISPECIES: hypothetical protein [unclassified Xenorhabdus]PHM51430.1 hypothetical protein Xekk_03738 [Xenorhabdus sp. KK7.4]PHM70293.1 hypothetical protein Xekj_01921 [Xenorhabdus sp. KJ12.1]